MTVFVFPFLHRRLPEDRFLRLCKPSRPSNDHADVSGLLAYPAGVVFFPFAWYFNYTSSTSLPASVIVILTVQMILRRTGDFAATCVVFAVTRCEGCR